jgi:hypothetical protein
MRTFSLMAAACVLLLVAEAHALDKKKHHISFETDCDGNAVTGFNIAGYASISSDFFKSCGLQNITSGGTFGTQQINDPVLGNVTGQESSAMLAGALTSSVSFAGLEFTFNPPVNEVSFNVLDLGSDNDVGITIEGDGGSNSQTSTFKRDGNSLVAFSAKRAQLITKVSISYTNSFDGWFIDSLNYNAWDCGDGEVEADNSETCDDGNTVHCDGTCGNDCKATIDGCFDGSTCTADGGHKPGSDICATCDVSKRVGSNEVGFVNVPAMPATPCNDGNFCSEMDQCNGAGACLGMAKDCDDGATCTVDTCNEGLDKCENTVAAGCFINGKCYVEKEVSDLDHCQACDPANDPTGFSQRPPDSQCGDPVCKDGTLTPAPLCDATGACITQPSMSCDGAVCADAMSCTGMCTKDSDCQTDHHCEDHTCKPDDPNGDPCDRPEQCESGFCADHVCCNAACDRVCESCNQQGAIGMCKGYEVGTDPEMECKDSQICASPGLCAPEDRPPGTMCDKDAQCASGHCTDGVCCNVACNGTCESCAVKGQEGTCSPYDVSQDPENECKGEQVCNGAGQCVGYETRGNGLCSAPAGGGRTTWWPAWLSAGLLLASRRRNRRRGRV